MKRYAQQWGPPLFWFGLLTWLIMAPLLRPGFVFALDMVPTPMWRLPDQVTSSYLFYAAMHGLNILIPAVILQKLLLIGIFLFMGLGMSRLTLYSGVARLLTGSGLRYAAYLAGLIYVMNPYVYARFMTGQFAVLLGYALLPWFVQSLWQTWRQPTRLNGIFMGLWAAAIGIVSIHTLGLVVLLAITAGAAALLPPRDRWSSVQRLGIAAGWSAVTFLIVSSYWLVPLVNGRSTTAAAISGFTAADHQAFATVGSSLPDKLGHVLRLEGMWIEKYGWYRLPQDIGPLWWLAFTAIICAAGYGVWRLWQTGYRRETVVLLATSAAAALLATGAGSEWLRGHVPLYNGYREPFKFAGLIPLSYAIFAGIGLGSALQSLHRRIPRYVPVVITVCVLVILCYASVLLRGGSGQIHTGQYPDGWYHANNMLNRDAMKYQVLFLPWHLYMNFGFAGTIMANPADNFFDHPILASNNPEIGGSTPNTPDKQVKFIDRRILPNAAERTDLGRRLSDLDVKYVLLAHEADTEDYAYLNHQADLTEVYRDPSITVYRNEAWHEIR